MQSTAQTAQPTVAGISAQLEHLWKTIDAYFVTFGPKDWTRKHGKDWTFADVPYHISYFDRVMCARPIEAGDALPESERPVMRTLGELNAWNDREFSKRPAGQPVEKSLEEMRAVRDSIRRSLARMSGASLNDRAYISLAIFNGWRTKFACLATVRMHTWSHVQQLRFNAGIKSPLPDPAVAAPAIDGFLQAMPAMVNPSAAPEKGFRMTFDLTAPGGGAWTLIVEKGGGRLVRERVPNPDLVMKMSTDTFSKAIWAEMQNPMAAMLTRKLKVKGFMKMGTFSKVMPRPAADTPLKPLDSLTIMP
jgi:putative sterol carrier protein